MEKKMFGVLIILGICTVSNLKMCHCLDTEATNKPQPKCPKRCVCSPDFINLHCKNTFKAEDHGLGSLTKTFSLKRDFKGPILNGTLKGLVSLEVIDLSNSMINYIQNGAFAELKNLKRLSLHGNEIQMLDEFMFKDNLLLEELDLSRNELYYLPDEPFRFLPNLRVLNVSYNMLISAKLGMRFQVTTRLTTIDFSGNFIENVTADDFITTQRWESNPKHLNFSNCQLKHIEPKAFLEFKKLESVDLSDNMDLYIDNVTDFMLVISTVALKKLDLSYTNLSNKIDLSELTLENLGTLSLQELILSGNGFKAIDNNLLTYLNLRKLILSENELTEIGEGIAKLSLLKYLDLSHNAISVVHSSFADNIDNLEVLKLANNSLSNESGLNMGRGTKLVEIDLSRNLLQTVVLPSLPKLKILNLSNNKIESINAGQPLAGLDKLELLDVSNNQLKSVGAFMFRDSKNITYVDFSGNGIETVSHQAFIPQSPKVLDLSKNSLTNIFHFAWHNVHRIILSDNLINNIEPQAFFFLDSLKTLDLSYNAISNIDVAVFSHLTNLTELYLQGNKLSQHLPIPEILAPLQSLLIIDLSSNNFSTFDFLPLPFSNNFDLEEIRLINNKIRMFSPYTFSSVAKLKIVDFSRNPFACGCENVQLQEWIKETNVYIQSQENFGYVCGSPMTRATKTLMNFETRTFECKRYLFYIVVFSSTGLACMLIAVSTASIVYFYKKRKRGKVDIEKKSEEVDLIGYEKVNELATEPEPITPEDYVRRIRENYVKGSASDTLIDVEFENPNLLIDNRDDEKIIKKDQSKKIKMDKKSRVKKTKSNQQKLSDAKKLKYYAQLYDILHEKNPKPRNDHKDYNKQNLKKLLESLDKEYKKRDDKDELKKVLKAMDREYRKVQEKKKHTRHKHHGKDKDKDKHRKHRRSRGNQELIKMLSLRQSRSMPDVLSYVNSLPRSRPHHRDHPYLRVPIYHIDHMDKGQHGWARSMVDLPRMHRSSRDLVDGYMGMKRRGLSYERFIDEDTIPRGYHTVSPGRRAMMVDSRLMDRGRSRDQLERRLIREQLLAEENLGRRERKLSRERLLDERSPSRRDIRISREQLLNEQEKQREKLLLAEQRPIIEDKLFDRSVEVTDPRNGKLSRQQSRIEEIQTEKIPNGYYTIATANGTTILDDKAKSKLRVKRSKSDEHLSQWV